MADFDPLQCATPYPSEEAPLCHIFEGSSESHTSTLCGATYYPDLCAILCKAFNLNDWRPGQLAACVAAMEQKDVLVTLPTGSGKSLCYQVCCIA
jgi:superfamily II DNA helicase RecQ